jgi:Mrp family chromosome partitioning ATPase
MLDEARVPREASVSRDRTTLELRIVTDPCRGIPKPRVRTFGRQGGDIGRAPHSYWVLPDPNCYVSAQHCSVEFRDGVFWLRDRSRNGVYLNASQEPVGRGNEVPLQHGDRIRLAQYVLLVRLVPRDLDAEFADSHAPREQGSNSPTHGELNDAEAARDADPADGRLNSAPKEFVPENNNTSVQTQVLRHPAYPAPDRAGTTNPEIGLQPEAQNVPPPAPDAFRSATLDAVAMQRNCVLLGGAEKQVVSAYKILRTRVRRRMAAQHWRSVGVSGAAEGAGKTLTAINLAIAFAQDSRSPAVLVDLDLSRPKVGEYLGMSFDKGLSDYLLGKAQIEDIVYSVGVPGLTIVPNGAPIPNTSELLATPRMTELVRYLESLRPQRTILYDLPPLLMSDDVLVFSPHMDCVLDVVAVGVTSRAALERSKEILAELNVVGVVLNRAIGWEKSSHYYY